MTSCGGRAGGGHGPVPWEHEPNRGFLRSLHALGQAAAALGEEDEAERCRTFLRDASATAAAELGISDHLFRPRLPTGGFRPWLLITAATTAEQPLSEPMPAVATGTASAGALAGSRNARAAGQSRGLG